MAVKVMLAPAIAQRANVPERKPRTGAAAQRPKRRRSSVYDAEGNEVFITLTCLKCRNLRPLSQFGLRKMTDGAIRNQPWCRTCRTGTSASSPERDRLEASDTAGAADPAANTAASPAAVVDASKIAAQIVAALHGGRR